MKELSKQDIEVVLAGKGLPGELLAGESLAKYFARLYLHTKDSRDEQLSQRDAQIAALTAENLDPKQYVVDELKYLSPETPATDAAANALRAEGLEMLAEQCDGYALNHVYTYTKRHAKEFAQQLREGK